MAYGPTPADNAKKTMSDQWEGVYYETFRLFAQLQAFRSQHALQWEETAELILPTSRNTFRYGSYNMPGVKKTDRQIDCTGMLALHRFAAILDSLLTPRNMFWHGLGADNDYLMKDRQVRLWFEIATKQLFKYRYNPDANFSANNQNNYLSLGAFGTGSMFIDTLETPYGPTPGIRYKHVPLGELYIHENHQGMVDGCIRHFRLTARQAKLMWPDIEKQVPQIEAALKMDSQMPYNFLHRVCARIDRDPSRIDFKGMPFADYYISIEGACVLEEGGYHTFPFAISRYEQTPGEVYGRGVASLVLPSLKTLNNMKKVHLKAGHRAADPVLLTADDGLVDWNMRPGAKNAGGWSAEGHPLVGVLPHGDVKISQEMMDGESGIIKDAFLVSLFQLLEETPQMTATEVIERTNEKGILLAPTVGRQQSEYLGPMIHRELDLLLRQRLLPPMPMLLREAKGEYSVAYTSPIARAMKASQAAGFVRTVETVKEIVNITGDVSYLDRFDFDTAIPAIAENQAVPESWMATDEQVIAKRKVRAQAQARQEQIQALPAQAAMMKAQATVQKNQPGISPGEQGMGGPVQQAA